MAEDSVEYQAYALLLRFLCESGKILVGAEGRVDRHVIGRIVVMCRCGFEYRIEVDGSHAKRLKVSEFLLDPLETPAVDRPLGDFALIVSYVIGSSVPVFLDDALCVPASVVDALYRFFTPLAPVIIPCKSAREYLVNYAVLIPFRNSRFLIYSDLE